MSAVVVTTEYVADIIARVANCIVGSGGKARATSYLHNLQEVDINPITPDGHRWELPILHYHEIMVI